MERILYIIPLVGNFSRIPMPQGIQSLGIAVHWSPNFIPRRNPESEAGEEESEEPERIQVEDLQSSKDDDRRAKNSQKIGTLVFSPIIENPAGPHLINDNFTSFVDFIRNIEEAKRSGIFRGKIESKTPSTTPSSINNTTSAIEETSSTFLPIGQESSNSTTPNPDSGNEPRVDEQTANPESNTTTLENPGFISAGDQLL